MRIGIFAGDTVAGEGGIDGVVARAKGAEEQGFDSFWLPQIFSDDALTVLAVVGREVPRIELGTSVVPTYPRHPMMLAAQAITTNAISGGRLALGIGLSHQIVIENMFGYSFEKPLRHMREYLSILMPLIRGEGASFDGETLKAHGALSIAGSAPFPVLLAALGPKMLELAGTVGDGTITWMTGPTTLRDHTVPAITAAATAAGEAAPRVVAALPVCVTDEPDDARQQAAKVFEVYGSLPSYRAMLDREGASGPADVALVGDEATVRSGIEAMAEAGATDFAAVEFARSEQERDRTRALLASML